MSANLVQLPTPDQSYSRDQIELVKRTLAKGATDDELALFLGTAKRMGLDPFAQQIRAIRRKEWNDATKSYESKLSIEPGIDGFRLIAARTHELEGRLGPFWCGTDGRWLDAWLKPEPPAAAKVGVLRKGFREPVWAVAHYREYVATKADGKPTKMWNDRPAGQLAKCAEALALRIAFPHELGGVYTSDEMAQAGPAFTSVQAGPAEVDGEPFEGGMPKAWAIDNVREPDDAKWLLTQPDVDEDYREAVKAVAEQVRSWSHFWRLATADQWRDALSQARHQMSGAGGMAPEGPTSPAPAPDLKSPPSPNDPEAEPTEADRSRAEGAHVDGTSQPGAGEVPPPPDATPPPARPPVPPRGRAGGTNRPTSGGANSAHADTPDRGRQGKPRESDGAAAGRDHTP
jgi:phage recombination protein Bet